MRYRSLLILLAAGACQRTPPAPAPAPRTVAGPPATTPASAVVPAQLRIVGTNDFHGALDPRPDESNRMRGGAAWMATAIRQAEHECVQPTCYSILVDGGDEFQGTAASNFVFGRSVVEVFNFLGYAAGAVGNHEFDWGQDTLRANMARAHYSLLAANIRYKDGRDVPWISSDTIVQRGPFKVGIIGVAYSETPITTIPANVADLSFVDAVPIIDSIAPTLRARGANFVIVVGHIPARCSGTPQTCTGEAVDIGSRLTQKIDAIISGHSHTRVDGEVKGIPLVQARSRGQAIEVVDLFTDGRPSAHEVREVYTDSIVPNPDVQRLVASANAWLDQVAPKVNKPVATIAAPLRMAGGAQTPLGNLIADGMRVVGGGDVAVMNNGGIRQSLLAGTATYGSLFEIQPFGNKLVKVRVRGADLKKYFAKALVTGRPNFHVSGARIVYHQTPAPGIDTLSVLGTPVNDQAIYSVILNDFSAAGGDNLGFGAAALSTLPLNIVDLDALIAYLGSLPQPVTAPAEQRLILRQ
jgi:2',3'-cyclic-nucleotide 2'-phosphodiesterase (5'-nucleotidase family)